MIPKVIHYCWFGGGEYSGKIKECIESWEKYCPDYEIKCWNEKNYDVHKIGYIEQAYESKKWAFVSDYARLDVVYNEGGIYLDTDVELLKSLDSLLDCEMYTSMESENYIAFGLGFAAAKSHPYIKEIMKYYEGRDFILSNGVLDMTACPIIQTNVLERHGLLRKDIYQEIPRCIIYPTEVMSPKSFKTGEIHITENTVSIHHFDMSWISNKEKEERQKEWDFKKKYGYKRGKVISMIMTGPRKVLNKCRNQGVKGTANYLKFVLENLKNGKVF